MVTSCCYLTWPPDLAASEGHTSPVEGGNIGIELTFKEVLRRQSRAYCTWNTTILYASILLEPSPQTSKMDTVQISCTLNNVKSFLGAFPSDLLPHSITEPSTVIFDTDAHRVRITLASYPSRTQVLHGILLWFLWPITSNSRYTTILNT